jgi:Tol biopolymer transport system component
MKKIACFILFFLPLASFAQNQNPSKLHYKKITTDNFEIVFPEEISEKAQQTANVLENLYQSNTNKLQSYPKPISLIMYNQSATSNAYARIAPRKMGWYVTPIQNSSLGITDWFTTLSLHEYAHVIQYNKNKQNFTKLASIFFGDFGHAVFQYSIPDWFFEGDAVYSETVFSESGRGRVSNFSLPIRTILLSDQKFNYSQAYLRSYRRFYPNHYYLGYYMVSHVYRNFGNETWSNVLNRTSLFSYWPYAFSRSLKKYTGFNIRNTYKNTMSELDSLWTTQIENLEITDALIINREKKNWETYFDCEFKNNDLIVGLKYSLSQNNKLFTIDLEGNENIIKEVDASMISVSGNKVVWASETPDIRWGEQSYSDIIVYDLETGDLKQITNKGKYFSPDINSEGNKIVAIEFTAEMKCSLVIFDTETGEIIKKVESPDNDYLRIPSWSEDDSKIVLCNASLIGQAMSIFDMKTEKFTEIIPYSYENFSRPVYYNNYILYNSEYSGIGNIYAIDLKTLQKYQVTSRKFGAYNPKISPDKTKILFQDYNENGYDFAIMNIDVNKWTKIEDVKLYKLDYFTTEEKKDEIKSLVTPDIYSTNKYEVTDYNEFRNLINIHSWMPNLLSDHTATLEVYSTNKLNTLDFTAGTNYNLRAEALNGYLTASYQKYFPVFDLTLKYGNEYNIYDDSLTFFTPKDSLKNIDVWDETNIGIGTWVPLNFSRGIYYRDLTFGANALYKFIKNKDVSYLDAEDLLFENTDGQFAYLNYFASFNNLKQLATRDVRTRFGQSLSIAYKHTIITDDWTANQLYAEGNFYFPGIFKNQSLKLNLGFEKQIKYDPNSTVNQYYFANKLSSIRGRNLNFYDLTYKLTVDYELPVLYPDLAFGSLIYFKRIKLLAFYDYFSGSLNDQVYNYQSTGAQLLFDLSFLRLNYEIELGVQAAYLLPENKIKYGLLIMGIEF